MQTDFIALYRGQTVAEAQLVAVTAEPRIVSRFLAELTGDDAEPEEWAETIEPQPLQVLRGGEDG